MPPTPAPIQKSTNPNANHQTGNAALVNCTDELANASKWSVCSLEIRSTHTRSFSLLRSLFSPSSPKQQIIPLYLFSHTHPLLFLLFFSFFLYIKQQQQQPHPLADLIRVAGVSPHPPTRYCSIRWQRYFPSPAHTLLKACTLPTLASPRTKPPGLFAPWISLLFPCLQAVMLLRQLLTMLESLVHGTSLDNATKP